MTTDDIIVTIISAYSSQCVMCSACTHLAIAVSFDNSCAAPALYTVVIIM
jgi:hypothetical protein